ncbi:MAG: DNA helicase RecQ [Gemmataceae bacterium]|nr:DNA helicase RecQ [Gemmataceae bacterium]
MTLDALKAVITKHWGYRSFRPLQEPAMRAVLEGRDSVVVLPTGGGKSLCYQAPAVLRGDTTVVVSPLISLMKDQVDSLRSCGVPAAQLDSSLSDTERFAYETDVRQGAVRLLFVSPERLAMANFQALLRQIDVRTFAIDEAHCISHWGHDFRPEYRQLMKLREVFPKVSIHAYTATATQRVRQDIINQLGLRQPELLVGNFDRPNLTYRVVPRRDLMKQVLEVIDRHPNEAGIIYCIRRKDVDELTPALVARGCKARSYHAGMTSDERRLAQEAFTQEACNIVVATVAFGMGIDRSNVRYVLHTGMPKSVEHYQQETGRAGRDGLEAECVLLYSGADFMTWKWIIEKSAEEPGVHPDFLPASMKHLQDMMRYCGTGVCRHVSLVEYFGQKHPGGACRACDICLGDVALVKDADVVAQKILSCVARVKESFGVSHVARVLQGGTSDMILKRGHDKLTTFGLLKEHHLYVIQEWIQQLIGQGVLLQVGDEYPVLKLNTASWEVMRKERSVRLVQPVKRKKDEKVEKSAADDVSWEGVDRELFATLRDLRRQLAEERNVPPYVIFNDATLRQLAAVRPSNAERMWLISGVGEAKLRDLGPRFLQVIADHCRQSGIAQDVAQAAPKREGPPKPAASTSELKRKPFFDLFRQQAAIDDVMHQTSRTRSTVTDYLTDFIREHRPKSIACWIKDDVYQQVAAAARRVGSDRLKPLYIELGEKVTYEEIRLVLAHLGDVPGDATA